MTHRLISNYHFRLCEMATAHSRSPCPRQPTWSVPVAALCASNTHANEDAYEATKRRMTVMKKNHNYKWYGCVNESRNDPAITSSPTPADEEAMDVVLPETTAVATTIIGCIAGATNFVVGTPPAPSSSSGGPPAPSSAWAEPPAPHHRRRHTAGAIVVVGRTSGDITVVSWTAGAVIVVGRTADGDGAGGS